MVYYYVLDFTISVKLAMLNAVQHYKLIHFECLVYSQPRLVPKPAFVLFIGGWTIDKS